MKLKKNYSKYHIIRLLRFENLIFLLLSIFLKVTFYNSSGHNVNSNQTDLIMDFVLIFFGISATIFLIALFMILPTMIWENNLEFKKGNEIDDKKSVSRKKDSNKELAL